MFRNPISKLIKILLLSVFLFGYHTCEHLEPGMGSSGLNTYKQTCFKVGEYSQGLNKVCQYNCVGSAHAITVGVAQLVQFQYKNNNWSHRSHKKLIINIECK